MTEQEWKVRVERTRVYELTVKSENRESALTKAVTDSESSVPTYDRLVANVTEPNSHGDNGYL